MHNFLTEVAQDWTPDNLAVVQDVLIQAERLTLDRTDPVTDPILGSPNLPNLRGQMRWVLVGTCLEAAAKSGRLSGIQSRWVPLGGSSALELFGQFTTVVACHLMGPEETPRESRYRRSHRIANEVSPMLQGFEAPEQVGDPLHLVLVHGGRDSSFAYLRAYYDNAIPSAYKALSDNIMKLPTLLHTGDVEMVEEPSIGLRTAAVTDVRSISGQR
jgi:hypothetical protein